MKLIVFAFIMCYIYASVSSKALADMSNFADGAKHRLFSTQPQPQKRDTDSSAQAQQQYKEMQDKLDFQYRQHQHPELHAKKVTLLPPMSHDEAMNLLSRISRTPAKKGQAEETPAMTPKACKYRKGTWSACDSDSKVRIRTDILRKGDSNICESVKTRKKDCKPSKKAKQRNNSKGRANKLKKE